MKSLIDFILSLFLSRETRLDRKANANPENLDWRHSVVDLMKLNGQDSSLAARGKLAKDLGYTGALNGSAEMNTWLHARLLDKL